MQSLPGILSGPKGATQALDDYASRLADLWAQLDQAASDGDSEARGFLLMFGPFVCEQLGRRRQ